MSLRKIPSWRPLRFWLGLILAFALISQFAGIQVFAAKTMRVPLTQARKDACARMLEKMGEGLPAGAQITGITITSTDWVCTSCKSHVQGISAKFPEEVAQCENCGSPMDPDEQYAQGAQGSDSHLAMRPAQIDAFLDMGANWACDYCHTTGNRDRLDGHFVTACAKCGASRPGHGTPASSPSSHSDSGSPQAMGTAAPASFVGQSIPEAAVVEASEDSPAGGDDATVVVNQGSAFREAAIVIPAAAMELPRFRDIRSFGDFRRTSALHARHHSTRASRVLDERTQDWPMRAFLTGVSRVRSTDDLRRVVIRDQRSSLISAGVMASLIAAPIFWGVTTSDTAFKGTVTYSRWIQTVRIEQYQPVIERASRPAIHESSPRMPVNGQGEQPGIHILECSGGTCLYETYKWMEVDSRVRRGSWNERIPGDSSWAGFEVPANGRIMMNTRFDVDFRFSANGEQHVAEWRPSTFAEFQRFSPGISITVGLDRLRNIEHIDTGAQQ